MGTRLTPTQRIDRATIEELNQFEKNLKKSVQLNVSFAHRLVSGMLLSRVKCRQAEWAERNWSNLSTQIEIRQLLDQSRIELPVNQ